MARRVAIVDKNKQEESIRARQKFINGRVIQLFMKGISHEGICEIIRTENGHPIGANRVQNIVETEITKWSKANPSDISKLRAMEIQKINHLEYTYWKAWEDSIKGQSNVKKIKRAEGEGSKMAVSSQHEEKRGSSGDPRYLKGVEWCIQKRCELLGVDNPVPQVAIQNNNVTNNTDNSKNTVLNYNRMIVFNTRKIPVQSQNVQIENS